MLEIDGSHGEGGGSILRNSIALSLLTQKPFRIVNIRKNRPKPGLSSQHLAAIDLALLLSGSKVSGNYLGSETVEFFPSEMKNKKVSLDIKTAGSITLALQSVIIPIIFMKKKVKIEIVGGTDVPFSPSVDYFERVLVPNFKRYSDVSVMLKRRGYYPKGQGKVVFSFKPNYDFVLDKLNLDDLGNPVFIRGVSHSSQGLEERRVADRQAEAALVFLGSHFNNKRISRQYVTCSGDGSGMTLYASYDHPEYFSQGICVSGHKKVRSEAVGESAAKKLVGIMKSGCVDEYLADQLVTLLGVVGGSFFTNKINDHLLSNIYVAEKFLDVKYEIGMNTNKISVKNGFYP